MSNDTAPVTTDVTRRAEALLGEHQELLYRRTDRLFAGLMVLQWLAGLAAAAWIAPRTWVGANSWTHPHVWDALFLGGAATLLPVTLALRQPGRELTRHVIAVGQLVMSGLLIHFTGGRIETHFHIFGSLAFLAFYRDWRVLITASAVTAADHYLRGVLWPQSLYGTASVEPWRWLEHAGWVVFEDAFLIISCVQSTREMRAIADRRARQEAAEAALEQARGRLEERVQERTAALRASEQRYRGLIDDSPEGVAVYCEGRLVYVNRAAQALLGASRPEDLLGRSIFDVVHPDFHALARERARRVQEDRLSSPLAPQKYVRLDGRAVDVEAVSTAILWEGKPAGQVLIRDITERLRAEAQIARLNAELAQRLERITALNAELAQAYDATIEGWSRALDLRDHETEGHSQRVADLTLRLAQAFGLAGEALLHLRRGALLHDIGKMGVPDAVLLKPGPLTDDERAVMQGHPALALSMLSPVAFLRPALDIPHCHHERWDGAGYPRGLRGVDIPLAARLFAVVDVWDALRSDRPYRRAWGAGRTRAHLASLAGTHFDPAVVDVFLKIVASHTELARAA